MAYHIVDTHKATAINDMEFESVEAALEFARAPGWTGARPTEITLLSDTSYKSGGFIFKVVAGENPRKLRAKAEAEKVVAAASRRSAFGKDGKFRGSAWLSREMDRQDSDF